MRTSKELNEFIDQINKNLESSDNYNLDVVKSLGKCLGMLKVLAIELEVNEKCLLADVNAN